MTLMMAIHEIAFLYHIDMSLNKICLLEEVSLFLCTWVDTKISTFISTIYVFFFLCAFSMNVQTFSLL